MLNFVYRANMKYNGTLEKTAFLEELFNLIEAEFPSKIKKKDNELCFEGGLLRLVTSLNGLIAIKKGEVKITSDNDIYVILDFSQLACFLFVIYCLLSSLFMFLYFTSGIENLHQLIIALTVGVTLLYFVNRIVAVVRFKRLVKRAMANEDGSSD